MTVSAVRKYFILGGCGGPDKEYFSLGVCDGPAIRNAGHGQLNGSKEVTLDRLLGGTVLYPPVKWLKAETIWQHPRLLERLISGRVYWF